MLVNKVLLGNMGDRDCHRMLCIIDQALDALLLGLLRGTQVFSRTEQQKTNA